MSSMRLSYVPIPGSHHVYLNGIEMRENVDWSDDGTGLLTFAPSFGEITGDKIEVLYAHYGEIHPLNVVTFLHTSSSDDPDSYPYNHPLPVGMAVGNDIFTLVLTNDAASLATPSGWDLVDTFPSTWFPKGWLYKKRYTGVETVFTIGGTVSGNVAVVSLECTPCTTGAIAKSAGGGTVTYPILSGLDIGQAVLCCVITANGVTGATLGSGISSGSPPTFTRMDSRRGDGVECVGIGYWIADATSSPSGVTGPLTFHDTYGFMLVQLT